MWCLFVSGLLSFEEAKRHQSKSYAEEVSLVRKLFDFVQAFSKSTALVN